MKQPLAAGLVGCGSVSQRGILPHLSQPDTRHSLRLVAVADAVAERAAETARRFDVPRHFASLDAMLAGADLDLVIVATPNPLHFANGLAAIQAGKHVYLQKTMTATLAEADQLLAARDRAGVKLAAAPGFELCPTVPPMRRLIQDGVLGRVCLAYTYTLGFGHEREPLRAGEGVLAEIDPSWYYRQGAGPLPNITVYPLQLLTCLLGPARKVTALGNRIGPERAWRGQRIPVEVDDNTALLVEFASGALGMAVGADCHRGSIHPWGSLSLHGTAGSLEVIGMNLSSGYPLRYQVNQGVWAAPGEEPRVFSAEMTDQPYLRGGHAEMEEPHVYADILDLARAVIEDRPPRASGEQARHVVEIIEKAGIAARTGQTQELTTVF